MNFKAEDWRPASERPPEREQIYFCVVLDSNGWKQGHILFWDGSAWHTDSEPVNPLIWKVVYWQPIDWEWPAGLITEKENGRV